MITVYIALGSNLGEREENLRTALLHFPEVGVRIKRVSSVYETEPVDFLEQDWFRLPICHISLRRSTSRTL